MPRSAILLSAICSVGLICASVTAWAAGADGWITVELKPESVSAPDPHRVWTDEEVALTRQGSLGNVWTGQAEVSGGTILVSRLQEISCNAECPVRVLLRRAGRPDITLFDDYAYTGAAASSARYAPMRYGVRQDLSALQTGQPQPLKLDRSGLK
ncbi:hypothetical protein [Inquilinus sp.]|uniref:hypothetical protein n=1 Tax=Inquilinus sp. TaxID=1932117 RepID=UPI0037852F81